MKKILIITPKLSINPFLPRALHYNDDPNIETKGTKVPGQAVQTQIGLLLGNSLGVVVKILYDLLFCDRIVLEWMDDLRFYVLFNSISVISGRWADDNDRLCAMEPRLRLKRSSPRAGLELTTTRSVGQRLTH